MSTTIQVKRRNLRLLEKLKKDLGSKSYDEVIEKLLLERMGASRDMFGIDKGRLTRFKETDRVEDR